MMLKHEYKYQEEMSVSSRNYSYEEVSVLLGMLVTAKHRGVAEYSIFDYKVIEENNIKLVGLYSEEWEYYSLSDIDGFENIYFEKEYLEIADTLCMRKEKQIRDVINIKNYFDIEDICMKPIWFFLQNVSFDDLLNYINHPVYGVYVKWRFMIGK